MRPRLPPAAADLLLPPPCAQEFITHLSSPPGGNPVARWAYTRRALQLKQQLLGLMQKVRELMLHPIVGYNGRELTINFSFSRRNLGEKAKR